VTKVAARILELVDLDCVAPWGYSLITIDEVISATKIWVERSVLGLNLCPFADNPYRSGRVRFVVSEQRSAAGLLDELGAELTRLAATEPLQCETTLLIHPWVLTDFIEYNNFLEACEATVAGLGLEGELQVASFHPQYQFSGSQPEDIENYTNRSPHPILHLLREASVERAVAAVGNTDEIYLRNMRTLRSLGHEGWRRLWLD
jgi:uncharacterized protein